MAIHKGPGRLETYPLSNGPFLLVEMAIIERGTEYVPMGRAMSLQRRFGVSSIIKAECLIPHVQGKSGQVNALQSSNSVISLQHVVELGPVKYIYPEQSPEVTKHLQRIDTTVMKFFIGHNQPTSKDRLYAT